MVGVFYNTILTGIKHGPPKHLSLSNGNLMDLKSILEIFMVVCLLPFHRFQWEMKISKWCSSSTSSR